MKHVFISLSLPLSFFCSFHIFLLSFIILSAFFLPFLPLHPPPPPIYSNLSNNRITDIEEGTFEGASGVNELILTSNRLENIHHRMLKGLSGLRTLWVHTHTHTPKCICKHIMDEIFKCALTYCDSVHTNIQNMPPCIIHRYILS